MWQVAYISQGDKRDGVAIYRVTFINVEVSHSTETNGKNSHVADICTDGAALFWMSIEMTLKNDRPVQHAKALIVLAATPPQCASNQVPEQRCKPAVACRDRPNP